MTEVPRDLDWIKERSACSLKQVFKDLKLGVSEDIRKINAIRNLDHPNSAYAERVIGPDGFAVSHPSLTGSVLFYLANDHIEIKIDKDSASQVLRATPILDDQGKCLLEIAGDKLEQWQVRRRALEGLFFGSNWND